MDILGKIAYRERERERERERTRNFWVNDDKFAELVNILEQYINNVTVLVHSMRLVFR